MTKRILHLIPTLSSGGAERQLVNVVTNTAPEEFEHLVCTLSDSAFYASLIREKRGEVRELGVTGSRSWFKAAPKFATVVREFQPNLINTWLYDANIAGRLAKLRGNFKTPLVTSLQATDYEPETIRSANWSPVKVDILRRFDKLLMRLTKPYFVACSQFVQASFERRLGINPKKTRVIYNAVNPDSLRCELDAARRFREELNIPTDGFVYLNIGRLDPQKNQALLLRAFAQILPRVSNAFLVITGAGSLESELKKLVNDLKISERVRMTGRRKDVGACLGMADVFIFPSHFEGLPLALVEAMFKSLPCIAADIAVLREVILHENNGLLINQNRIEEIAGAMIRLYEQPDLRRKFGVAALHEAQTRFNAKTTAIEWEDFYRQIIDENS